MTAGKTVSRTDIDQTMADVASRWISLLQDQVELQRWNARTTQADLEGNPYQYSADEAYLIKTTLDRLAQAATWLNNGPLPPDTHATVDDLAKFTGMGVIG